jgi:hypothetical protein
MVGLGGYVGHVGNQDLFVKAEGTVKGDIVNGRTITLQTHGTYGGEEFVYEGTVGDDGLVHGGSAYKTTTPEEKWPWSSETPLKCDALWRS